MYNGKVTKRGMSPGALVFTGKQKVDKVSIRVFDFDAHSINEKEIHNLSELAAFKDSPKISWLNVTGLHGPETIEKIGEVFNLHPLTLEDILNVHHSPKLDNYEEYLFVIAKMIDLTPVQSLNIEQVSFVLGKNYLITFQEDDEDVFNIIRQRLRENLGRIRKSGADYLMYRLLDSIVDNYFIILENFDQRIERMEDKLFLDPDKASIASLYTLRKEIIHLRRAVLPMRDIIYSLEKERESFVKKNTYIYLHDLSDHLKHFVDSLDSHREAMNGIIDVYLSNSSHKMNEVIKFLTVISTIFIPLTFIVGIYGMNFKTEVSRWNMPELAWRFGYPLVMIFMLLIAAGLIYYFKRKKWF